MLVHLVSLENEDVIKTYDTVRAEIKNFDPNILQKNEIVLLTKTDLVSKEDVEAKKALFLKLGKTVASVSVIDDESVKTFSDVLSKTLSS